MLVEGVTRQIAVSALLAPERGQWRMNLSNVVITGRALPLSSKKPREARGPVTAGSPKIHPYRAQLNNKIKPGATRKTREMVIHQQGLSLFVGR